MSKRPDDFTIEAGELEGVPLLSLRGIFRNPPACDWTRAEVKKAVASKPKVVVIDLGGVEKIDSPAIGALVEASVSAQRRGGRARLAEVPETVMMLLKIAKIDTLFEIYPDRRSAVNGENQQ